MVALTSTRWRLEARLKRTKANSPICARDIPTCRKTQFNTCQQLNYRKEVISMRLWSQLTRNAVLLLYPNPLTTMAIIIVFIVTTKMTDASNISTWFQRNWTWISIPMLARKRAAKRLRMGSICKTNKLEYFQLCQKESIMHRRIRKRLM